MAAKYLEAFRMRVFPHYDPVPVDAAIFNLFFLAART
jgi:hypothetical protein